MLSLALVLTALTLPGSVALEGPGPRVGQLAPEPGLRGWIRKGGAPAGTLAKLRGRVVILHTFAWNCSSCLRVGLPLSVDLLRANRERGLTVLSITTPANREETLEVLAEYGVEHPVASENPFTNENAYVDASVNPITYMFVIGRNGDVVWRGDPSTQEEECLEAVARALDQAAGRGLERELVPELEEAVASFFAGSYAEAREQAARLQKKNERSRKSSAPAIAADAAWLVARIDALGEELASELELSLAEGGGLRSARVLAALEEFREAPVWERAGPWVERAEADTAVHEAAEWLALAAARPALFPTRADKASKKYAKLLGKYASRAKGSPHATLALEWREQFEQLHP